MTTTRGYTVLGWLAWQVITRVAKRKMAQNKVKLGAAVVHEVRLEAVDRLDAVLLARLVVLDRPVHHPVVREAERRLAKRGRTLGERVDRTRAVEHRVLGVDVEMGEAHRGTSILSTVADAAGRRFRNFGAQPAAKKGRHATAVPCLT